MKKTVSFKNTRKLKLPFTKPKHHNIVVFKNTHENVEARKSVTPKHTNNNNNNHNEPTFFKKTPRHVRKEKVRNTIRKTTWKGKHFLNNTKTRKG